MSVDVSVVVPVYNTGDYIEPCIASLLAQSLPAERYELIFVDDGSTDTTPQRLDDLAAAHTNVRVCREPNSGWPGRPRNVGLDVAAGDYVFFCDHDDWLAPEALERMVAFARRTGADIVVPKMVGHGRGVPRELFRRNIEAATLTEAPLMSSLTPHKLFRRAFLLEHELRFPEGRRRLEDHVFVVAAYLRADRIAVLADYPCYHHIRREDAANAAHQQVDPVMYYANLREVLDLIERHVPPGPKRDALLERPFAQQMLNRLGPWRYMSALDEHRYDLLREIRTLMLERFPVDYADRFGPVLRARAAAIRADDMPALVQLAEHVDRWHAAVVLRELRRDGAAWLADIEAELVLPDGSPLQLTATSEARWRVDERLVPAPLQTGPVTTEEVLRAGGTVSAVDRRRDLMWFADDALAAALRPAAAAPGTARLVLTGTVRLDPMTLAAGGPLEPGRWHLQVRVSALGTAVQGWLVPDRPESFSPDRAVVGRVAVRLRSTPAGLALDVRRRPRPAERRPREPAAGTRPQPPLGGLRRAVQRIRRVVRRNCRTRG
ncbi:MAG TPA: glycosyltransferase family 2 protein [Mycobacteriales bacterium]|nr:glycosyltransferase family 2 protein [Mycobacteriales bacterium]